MKTRLLRQVRREYRIYRADKEPDPTSINYRLPLQIPIYVVYDAFNNKPLRYYNTYDSAHIFLVTTIRSRFIINVKGQNYLHKGDIVWPR